MKRILSKLPLRVLLLRRSWWTAAFCLLAAAAMFYVVNYPAAVGAAAAVRQLPIYCVQRDHKLVSISFDAAWGNEDTQQLIDILAEYDIPATFFVVGSWVDKYPESVKALADAGHEVMNHSNTHAHYPQLSAAEVVADLNACNDKIEAVTGVRPTLVRFPYGDYDDNSIAAARSIGMEPIQWDVDTLSTAEIHCGPACSTQVALSRQTLFSHRFPLSRQKMAASPVSKRSEKPPFPFVFKIR